jgi:NTE family protein
MKKRRNSDAPIALVISGGGSKGAFAVGVVKYLFDTYRSDGWFSLVGGVSTGALIAPMAALMAGPEEMARDAYETLIYFYTHVSTKDVLQPKGVVGLVQRQDSLNRTAPLRRLIRHLFYPECFEWLQRPEAPECFVVYTNFITGEKVVTSAKDPGMTRERFMDAMLASASVPVIMEPTNIDGDICYDGGLRDIIPFETAVRKGAEVIVPIFLDPVELERSSEHYDRLDKVIYRSLEIVMSETMSNDYLLTKQAEIALRAKRRILQEIKTHPLLSRRIRRIFESVEFCALFNQECRVDRIVEGLRPDSVLTTDYLTFDPDEMTGWLRAGEEKASRVLTTSPFLNRLP